MNDIARPGGSMLRNTEMLLREHGEFLIPVDWDESWVLKELNLRLRPERRVRAATDPEYGRILVLSRVWPPRSGDSGSR